MASVTKMNMEDAGVFELLSELCTQTASKYCTNNRISQKQLSSKMRSRSYELILHRTTKRLPCSTGEPIGDLLSYYFVSQQNIKNTAEFKKSLELKRIISSIRQTDFGEDKENVYNILKCLIQLSNSVIDDVSSEMYQRPFSFGVLDKMLPKLPREAFGSPQPYSYFPSHVFHLPFALRREAHLDWQKSQTYTDYTVESLDSKSYMPDHKYSEMSANWEVKTFKSPMSLGSLTSSHMSPYSTSSFNYPRLTAPRDLMIPGTPRSLSPKAKVYLPSTPPHLSDIQEVFRADTVDIWELATQVDKDIPNDIWEVVSKMPPTSERQLIATSSREVLLWRQTHDDYMSDLNVISEKQFIRHIMYLIIGVETNSFPYSQESNCFYMKEKLVLEGISDQHLKGYMSGLCLIGTYYKRLYDFSFNHTLEDHFHSNGLIYEATREVIRRYLLEFRLKATQIFDDCFTSRSEGLNCMPTLLQVMFHMEPLKYEIEGMASIFKITGLDGRSTLPSRAELMSYLFNEITLVTHRQTALTAFNSLFYVCQVYFKFIEKFIFDGELQDRYHEFFIRKDSQYVHSRSKRYWDKGQSQRFHISQGVAVPEFLRSLVKFILLCGKSLRLLKMCNPSDPLVLLISSDHPTVKCCTSFKALEHQQQLLDVYRTRCLFVSGELVTFDQILLKKEAERKAFTEMAAVKQAETLEKIVAERKRLAQLIVAEKQHSLRILEAAMAEAKAAKGKSKLREKRRLEMEAMGDQATEEVDSRLRDDEKNKIMEYYSKLNMEVEKKQIHTEWKIRRLQLDQSRMQLYSTEERNLKREKLELEHQRSEVMAMSIDSQPKDETDNDETPVDTPESKKEINTEFVTKETTMEDIKEKPTHTELEQNTKSGHSSGHVFSAICNAAKHIFRSMTHEDKYCDNKKELDSQGNEIEEKNVNKATKTSSYVIGANIDNVHDNEQYQILQRQAYLNKQKVMAHEYGTDNRLADTPALNKDTIDEENNVLTTFDEAKRNKMKVLGTEYYLEPKIVTKAAPCTDAQKEAVINRLKVLGVEYNVPTDFLYENEPKNVAQEEAIRNRKKVLESEFETRPKESMFFPKRDVAKRSGLTLNLKPMDTYDVLTPNTCVTPGEMFARLDLETPTTADVALDSALASEMFSPRSDCSKDIESEKKRDKGYLTSEGFNFIVDVTADSEANSGMAESSENSPMKTVEMVELKDYKSKNSQFNILDGSYSLDDFDPFGLKEIRPLSSSYCLSNKMDSDMTNSCYTHPALIMEKVKQRPCSNIHTTHFGFDDGEEEKVLCDNIATLTACLQRSVLLPLTYQLEVVNNSILTYFLVNLDMYEHLRSLKDYFFLMDGEFSRSICHNLFAKLTKTLSPQELLNFSTLHSILDKALGSSISHIHKFSENLSFTMTDTPLSFQHSSPDVLQCLSLTYTVSWPLNIILSNEALQRYAKVFQFLVKMRRIFWVLGEDFQNLKLATKLSRQHSRKLLRSPQYLSIQIYRHVMASMIRALDNYIVTTCILTSWTEFENDLKKARTLDDLYECHVIYIKKVIFRCLLNNRSTPVMKLLNDIFTVVLKFSRVLKAGEWQQKETNGAFVHTSFGQLQELFHLFEKLAKYLHKVVTKLMECGYQRHLVELLTMVNLNGYYDPERSKDEQNTSVQ